MRAKRPCAEPGCPVLTNDTRCLAHARQRDQARGTRQQRGYDTEHQRLRAQWAPLVTAGNVTCWRCHRLIAPRQAWHLGHDDVDRSRYRGPECVPCNTATSGRRLSG